MDLGLKDKVVDVVGGAGIGRACADLLVKEGAVLASGDGRVDIVIAHGEGRGTAMLDVTSAEELHGAWDAVVQAVARYHEVLPGMTERRWGRLVWIGPAQAKSVDAALPGQGDELDAVVTLGMMGLSKVIAHEEGPANVTANVVLRGGDATDEDVAAVVAYLCSDDATYVSGTTITVDGGVGSAIF